jgi:hypothetical protein
MVYNSQNYWIFGLCPSSGILEAKKLNVSGTESISVLRWGGARHLLSWVSQKELTSTTVTGVISL